MQTEIPRGVNHLGFGNDLFENISLNHFVLSMLYEDSNLTDVHVEVSSLLFTHVARLRKLSFIDATWMPIYEVWGTRNVIPIIWFRETSSSHTCLLLFIPFFLFFYNPLNDEYFQFGLQ